MMGKQTVELGFWCFYSPLCGCWVYCYLQATYIS